MGGSRRFAAFLLPWFVAAAVLWPGQSSAASPASAQTNALRTEGVSPVDLDPASSPGLPPHVVAFDPSVSSRGELFVFLQGFLATPADTTLIVQQAAATGFHAVGLAYAKPANVPPLCQTDPDEGCYESTRRAVIYGDVSPFAEVSPADSMMNQLTKLLAHLAARYPDEGWATYLADDAPDWAAMRLGGHSEGGTHATLIARDHALARLCVFESPVDLVGPPSGLQHLAPWISARGATPAERIYGFRHVHTSSTSWPAFEGAWGLLGVDGFGPAVDVDTVGPPYDGSHHLTTDAAPAVADETPNLTHRSVVEDRLTPKTTAGEPLFAPVWQYACFS